MWATIVICIIISLITVNTIIVFASYNKKDFSIWLNEDDKKYNDDVVSVVNKNLKLITDIIFVKYKDSLGSTTIKKEDFKMCRDINKFSNKKAIMRSNMAVSQKNIDIFRSYLLHCDKDIRKNILSDLSRLVIKKPKLNIEDIENENKADFMLINYILNSLLSIYFLV